MARFDLSDEEWTVIQPLLPHQTRGAKRGMYMTATIYSDSLLNTLNFKSISD
jgi:transposase